MGHSGRNNNHCDEQAINYAKHLYSSTSLAVQEVASRICFSGSQHESSRIGFKVTGYDQWDQSAGL
jgi:hypothetical protein